MKSKKIPYLQSLETGYASIVYPVELSEDLLEKLIERGWVDRSRVTQRSDGSYLVELWGAYTSAAFSFLHLRYKQLQQPVYPV